MVRYLCTGLIIHTLKITGVKNIDGLLSALIFCLGKRGMTPYTKILSYLSQFAEVREKLEK